MTKVRRPAKRKAGLIRILVRSIGVLLFLALPAIWLLVKLDWLDAGSLSVGPPLLVTGILLIAADRFLLGKWEAQ